jgi:hypothetical protein
MSRIWYFICKNGVILRIKINNQEKSTDKIIKKNTEEMKKEEKIIKNEKSNVKNFISSLNDLYNKKFITINNNDKVIQKQEKSKKQILNIETPPNPSSITRKSQELYLNTNENIFLEEKIISPSEEKKYDTDKFCECFFWHCFQQMTEKLPQIQKFFLLIVDTKFVLSYPLWNLILYINILKILKILKLII